MIYLFDKKQTLTGVIDEHTQALNATLEMKINEASTLDFALPLDNELSEKMDNVKYVGVPSPNSADKIVFLRLMTINDETDRVEYMAKELAYQELSSNGYIEDKRPVESDAQTLMNIALDGSGYKLGVVNVPGKVKTNFYYTDHLSAISNIVELLGGEIYFYVSITGSKITGRYMDYVAEQGTNTSKTFADGSNLITVERKRDMSSVYTAILPRGKGEQVSSVENDTPDGYGRRINIAGITWSKANGNPLDKKLGDKTLVDPDATAEYGNADGTPRLLLKTYDDIEDANILINKAYMDLMAINKPAVQYSAMVANVGDMQLGDTIVIMHSKRSMSYRTRVFHITYDLIDNTKTVAEFGNDLSKDSITNQINSISSNGATISDQVQWNISNGGHNNTSYGAQEPANPRVGDVWFKQLPNGNTEEYYFDGTVWVLGAKTDQQWQENQAIAQGTHTTFYGIAVPVGAVKGDVWFKNDNNAPDGKSMYTYDGTNWIKFEGSADASRLQIGTIDASKINVMNLSASNIVTGNLSANFLKGGQIDASQINVINVNAQNLIGRNAEFFRANFEDTYGNSVTIDSNSVNFKFQLSGVDRQIYNRINQAGFSITSNMDLSSGIIGEVVNFGIKTSGFTTEKTIYHLNNPGITIGDGKNYKAENMAWGIGVNQGYGSAPQLIWAGYNVGKVSSTYKTWDNPAGWILPENIRFSTWDNTASYVWFDNTVNVNMQALDFRITHYNDDSVFAHKWQGKINGYSAIGMTTGTDQSGWALTGDDTWLFVHGKPYSVYQILSKVGMI
jgi:phage minor structural protein|nr:MAG TPA: tail protein [Caudoviricetes sp.]